MKRYHHIFKLLFLFVFILACDKSEYDFSTFESAIAVGGDFPPIEYDESSEEIGESESQTGDEIWTCTSELVSIKDALGGDNNFSMFSPNADVIFPGNLLQGRSLKKATPDEIPADRSGGDITISILDGNDRSTIEVNQISINEVTQAANDILAGKDAESVIPSNFQLSKSIVQSEKEYAFRIGADYENSWASVSGNLSFSNQTNYSRMMVSLEQTFYTMIFTTPFSEDDFFAPGADPEDLKRFIGPGNPPCYIKSVNYGRIFYMLIESSASETELKTAVDASFEGLTSEGGGSFESEYFSNHDEVNIKIFALGGDASVTIEAGGITKNNLYKINEILKRATDIRTGVPISYKAQSVKTNQVVAVQLATDYERKTCTVTSALPPPAATSHWGGVINLLGSPVGAMVRLDAVEVFENADIPILFLDTLGQKCVLDDGISLHGPYDNVKEFYLEYYGTELDVPFDEIGAGCTYISPIIGTNNKTKKTVFFNKIGNRYIERKTGNYGNFSSPDLIGNHKLFGYFETEGISAMTDYFPFGVITVNKQGKRMKITTHIEDWDTAEDGDVNVFTGGPESNKFLDGISGLARLDDFVFASIDKAGKRYMVVDVEDSSNIKYFGPFKLKI